MGNLEKDFFWKSKEACLFVLGLVGFRVKQCEVVAA